MLLSWVGLVFKCRYEVTREYERVSLEANVTCDGDGGIVSLSCWLVVVLELELGLEALMEKHDNIFRR